MNGGTLKNQQGHLFHVTNTNAIITLNGVKLVYVNGKELKTKE